MDECLISVIVLVYNVEMYIRKCLDNIIKQTYRNFEIILVDYGSQDSNGKVCDEYADRDKRISVIHKKNGNLSSVRNVGMDATKGDYLTFIDNDDYIALDMFRYVAEAITIQAVDLVFIREKSVDTDGNTLFINGNDEPGYTRFGSQVDAADIIIDRQFNGMCDKTYRREMLRDICVVEGKKHGEDLLLICRQVLAKVKRMAYVGKILYNCLMNSGQISHESYSPMLWMNWSLRMKQRTSSPRSFRCIWI